jgi:hypothetical protein
MKIGTAILISLVAVVALVAEIILYSFLGFGAALAGSEAAVSGLAFVIVGLMVVTAALVVLAPMSALIGLVTKKENVGAWVLLSGLLVVGAGYVGLTLTGSSFIRVKPSATATRVEPRSTELAGAPVSVAAPVAPPLIEVRLLRKNLAEENYQKFVFFDIEYRATGLKKPARAIKGTLLLQDLFGETKMRLRWTIDKPMAPGQVLVEKGVGFEYNMLMDDHRWAASVELENMKVAFRPTNIIYQDGTTEDIDSSR